MKVFLLVFILLPLTCSAVEPLFALIEYDPWRSVIGSDSATFAYYDDGVAIFSKIGENGKHQYRTVFLKNDSSFIDLVISPRVKKFKEYYALSKGFDAPTTRFVWKDHEVQIYGSLSKPRLPMENPDFRKDYDEDKDYYDKSLKKGINKWKKRIRKLPKGLFEIYRETKNYSNKKSETWLPKYIEVMFWPYEYAPEESVIWPQNWPDLKSDTTKIRGQDSFSVFVKSEEYKDLQTFLKTRKQKGAVLINGRKMAVSLRFPIPGEKHWMQ